jgi:RNA polymerase subunit RPABC4/transcription elongation factor Spt4
MTKKKDIPDTCPLCDTKLNIPSYVCKKCQKFLIDDEVLKTKDKQVRCGKCNSFVGPVKIEELGENVKCKDCGFNLNEMDNLMDASNLSKKSAKGKKVTSLKEKLELLTIEIDKILEEPDEEEIEIYTCPDCDAVIQIDDEICPNCGISFVDLEELPEGADSREDTDQFECSDCHTLVNYDEPKCPNCGLVFEEGKDDVFVCPTCHEIIDSKTTECPNCLTQFVTMEDNIEMAISDLLEAESKFDKMKETDESPQIEDLMDGLSELQVVKKPRSPKPGKPPLKPEIEKEIIQVHKEPDPEKEIETKSKQDTEPETEDENVVESEAPSEPIIEEESVPEVQETQEPEVKEEYLLIIPEEGTEIVYEEEEKVQEEMGSLETPGTEEDNEQIIRSSGLTNGRTNGMRVPKYAQTTDHFMGDKGATNGFTNGLTNGLRAIKTGLTNGLTNGNGITNGLSSRKSESGSRKGKAKMIIVPIIVLMMVFSPYIINNLTESPKGIDIDGRFEDWKGVTTFSDEMETSGFNPNVDIIEYRIDDRRMDISFYLRVEGEILSGEPGGERHVDTAYILIDTDRNVQTGYFIKDIGADYMLEIYGWNQKIIKSSILTYETTDQDWNLFENIGAVTAAAGGSELEVKVPLSTMILDKKDVVDAIFYMQSWDGYGDFSDTVISNEKGVLLVKQQGVSEDVITGEGNRILRLDMEAFSSDITVDTLRVQRSGLGDERDIGRAVLEDHQGNFIALGTESGDEIEFRPQYSISMDQISTLYVVMDVGTNAQPENSVGFYIDNKNDIVIDQGVSHLKRVKPDNNRNEEGYIASVPENITIDGAFPDWDGKVMKNDSSDDVKRPDLDIIKYGASATDSKASFYIEVDEDIVGGMKVPHWNRKRKMDPIVGGGTSDATGPEVPPKTGEDIVYIFVDSQPDSGYKGLLPLTANHLIEVKGRHNKVLSRVVYDWIGTNSNEWNWVPKGVPEVELDSYQMEVGTDLNLLGISRSNQSFDVFFWATDWQKSEKDTSDYEGAISPPRGTRAETLSEVVSGVGSENNDRFGWNVSYAGDVNDDGVPDIIVGAPYNDSSDGSKSDCGAAYIFFGYSGISSGDINAASANVSIYGETAGDHFGWDVSDLGNVDSDTKDDVIIGAPDAGAGKVYIFNGRTSWSATYAASAADDTISGERYGDKFGFSVSGAQDTDSSNYNEVLVGAPYYSGLDWWNNNWNLRKRLKFDKKSKLSEFRLFKGEVRWFRSAFY